MSLNIRMDTEMQIKHATIPGISLISNPFHWQSPEKHQTGRGKHNISMWENPRQNLNIMSYATLFIVLIQQSSFTTLNPIALQILTKFYDYLKHNGLSKTSSCEKQYFWYSKKPIIHISGSLYNLCRLYIHL